MRERAEIESRSQWGWERGGERERVQAPLACTCACATLPTYVQSILFLPLPMMYFICT